MGRAVRELLNSALRMRGRPLAYVSGAAYGVEHHMVVVSDMSEPPNAVYNDARVGRFAHVCHYDDVVLKVMC
jgi:hypothetical protein